MNYERTKQGRTQLRIPLEGSEHEVIFQASGVRKERTGVHASVTVALGPSLMILDEDLFNVERREDRNRLANSAVRSSLPPVGLRPLLEPVLQHHLMLFCRGLWEYEVEQAVMAEKRGGASERKGPNWLLAPYQLHNAGTILFAPPGRGKSWLALLWAVSCDSGNQALFDVRGSTPTLFINLERSQQSVDARLGDVNQVLGFHRERPLFRIDARGRSLADVFDRASNLVQREGIEFTILDSLSRGGFGDLNDNVAGNKAMDGLNALSPGWMALGHTPRGDESHLFGSQMFDAAADIEVVVLTQERSGVLGVGLRGAKANDVRKPPLSVYAIQFDDKGLADVRRAYPGEFLEIETDGKEMDSTDALVMFMREMGEATASELHEVSGIPRRTVLDILQRSGQFVSLPKTGRRRPFALKDDVADVADSSPRSAIFSPRTTSGSGGEATSYTPPHHFESEMSPF